MIQKKNKYAKPSGEGSRTTKTDLSSFGNWDERQECDTDHRVWNRGYPNALKENKTRNLIKLQVKLQFNTEET